MTSDKWLIDASYENAKAVLEGVPYYPDEIWKFAAMAKRFPTVDAAEVVHGRWEAAGFDGHGDYKECCSSCKSWSIGEDKLYCPVCGAKMDV